MTEALLLRAVDYRDSDRIVTFLTRESGKIEAIARGARKSRRRFAGSLSPMSVLCIDFKPSQKSLATLNQARITRSFPRLLKDLNRTLLAGAGLAAMRQLVTDQEADPVLFDCGVEWLELLDESDAVGAVHFLTFLCRLLSVLGVPPGLSECASCSRAPTDAQTALFDPKAGSIVCISCGGGPLKLSPPLRLALKSAQEPTWSKQSMEWASQDTKTAEILLQRFVEEQLRQQLGGFELVGQLRSAR